MKKVCITIGLLVLISGCSTRLIYPNLDWLIPLYIDDYISLDREQDRQLDNELAALLDWHCQTQLPAYATTLRALAEELNRTPGSLTVAQIDSLVIGFEEHWQLLLSRILPRAAQLLARASDDQVVELIGNLVSGNDEFRQKYVAVSLSQSQQTRAIKMVDRLERWVGQLKMNQQQAVERWSLQLRNSGAARLTYRRLLVAELSKILAERKNSTAYQQKLIDLLTNLETMKSPDYIQVIQHNRRVTYQLLVDLHFTLDQEQHQLLRKNILQVAKDFEALACHSVDPAQPVSDN